MHIEGDCQPEFDAVRTEFERNFALRNETGAACCIYFQGQKVVDLWGGQRSPGSDWQADTLALTFSVTKGMAAAALVVAHSRGLFDLDMPVAEYWPDFAQGGKERITVRQLLTHQAGLISLDESLTIETVADRDRLAQILARQKPAWQPGTRHGYHTLTLGWYQSELLRRIDPAGRTIGQFFQDEIAGPLGLHFYIGLPSHIAEDQLAVTAGFHRLAVLRHLGELPIAMVLAGLWPSSHVARSVNPLRLNNPAQLGSAEYRRLEIPSANGFGQARAIAKIYSALAADEHELRISPDTRRELLTPASVPLGGSSDVVLKIDTRYGFGFSRPSSAMRFGSDESAFGCPGAGGCFAMADPSEQLGYAYITNKMGFRLFDDPRERACREACHGCLALLRNTKRTARGNNLSPAGDRTQRHRRAHRQRI
jgi:CubicO group peptidase (beta-lactamase class C family)